MREKLFCFAVVLKKLTARGACLQKDLFCVVGLSEGKRSSCLKGHDPYSREPHRSFLSFQITWFCFEYAVLKLLSSVCSEEV